MQPTRTDLINFLIKKYNLKSFLEIGCQKNVNFNAIECKKKVSVDPDPAANATFCMTSDEYFYNNFEVFDIIFIDGLHEYQQVKKDFENSYRVISANGFIILHDCNPIGEEFTSVPRETKVWYGDVYKFAAQLGTNWLSFKTIDMDCGCGVFMPNTQEYALREVPTWEHFEQNRDRLLNLISWEDFLKTHN